MEGGGKRDTALDLLSDLFQPKRRRRRALPAHC